jgi:hypothetical protein
VSQHHVSEDLNPQNLFKFWPSWLTYRNADRLDFKSIQPSKFRKFIFCAIIMKLILSLKRSTLIWFKQLQIVFEIFSCTVHLDIIRVFLFTNWCTRELL